MAFIYCNEKKRSSQSNIITMNFFTNLCFKKHRIVFIDQKILKFLVQLKLTFNFYKNGFC